MLPAPVSYPYSTPTMTTHSTHIARSLQGWIAAVFLFTVVDIAAAASTATTAVPSRAEDIRMLETVLNEQGAYDSAKVAEIRTLEGAFGELRGDNREATGEEFVQAKALFDAYKSYNYARSKHYADLLAEIAARSGDLRQQYEAQYCQLFALLSAGLFKEGYDLQQRMIVPEKDSLAWAEYHILSARLMLDMAVYAGEGYSYDYGLAYKRHYEQALERLTPRDTFLYYSCTASLAEQDAQWDDALTFYRMSLQDSRETLHDSAVTYSSMAFVYSQLGNREAMLHYNALSAAADIRSCTKETVALRRVAQTLYEDGEVSTAARFIRKAEEDAQFYGARHREMELMQILPIIETENEKLLQVKTHRIWGLTIISLLLLIGMVGALFLVQKYLRQAKAANRTIQEMNRNLLVANRLKEEYIGTMLSSQSLYIGEVERYQQKVIQCVNKKRWDDLLTIPKSVDARRKRTEFYKQFDEMVLHIFPSFVQDFNALLRPDEQIVLKKGELLNTELRIFALLRLGITHNEVIADVLDYSLTTIYTYKTKVKSRSDFSNEEFQAGLMAIPSFVP